MGKKLPLREGIIFLHIIINVGKTKHTHVVFLSEIISRKYSYVDLDDHYRCIRIAFVARIFKNIPTLTLTLTLPLPTTISLIKIIRKAIKSCYKLKIVKKIRRDFFFL